MELKKLSQRLKKMSEHCSTSELFCFLGWFGLMFTVFCVVLYKFITINL